MRIEGKRRKGRSTAGAKGTSEELPSDLILDILSRLPVKTLIRFKCVSKQWYSLISDPSFVNLHRHKSPPKLRLLCIECVGNFDIVRKRPCSFRFTSMDRKGKVLQAYHKKAPFFYRGYIRDVHCENELICFKAPARTGVGSDQIYVCNPTIHELVTLPEYSPSKRLRIRNLHTIGFAYLSSTEEYKVVRVFHCDPNSSMYCEVLSFPAGRRISSSSWKIIDEKWPLEVHTGRKSVSAHGCLNWLADEHGHDYFSEGAIVSFDLMSEKFRILPAPFNEKPRGITLGCTAAGKLSFIKAYNEYGRRMKIVAWILEDLDKCSWIKACKIYLEPIIGKYFDHTDIDDFGIDVVNGKLLISLWDHYQVHQKYIYYNVEDKTFRRVKIPKCRGHLGFYWESMVSL